MNRFKIDAFCYLIMVALIFSCTTPDDHVELPPKDPNLHLTIKDVKSMYSDIDKEDVEYGSDIDSIFGVVISDAKIGNNPENLVILQEDSDGIGIDVSDYSENLSLSTGDSVAVDIQGGTLVNENGNFIIKGPSASDFEKIASDKKVEPVNVVLSDLSSDLQKYNFTLVKASGVNLFPTPDEGSKLEGSMGLSDGTVKEGAVRLFINPDSDLANEEAPDNATFTGIAMFDEVEGDSIEKRILPRNNSDIDVTTDPVYSDIVLTGFMADPRGFDQKIPGEETKYGGGAEDGGVTVYHKGGYEYVQFMALKDIDFSETPFSVVVARDGVLKGGSEPFVTENGWAEGGKHTYKFNLTEGKAEAGTFFYVGSSSKELAGYWPEGQSQDISGANWIRSIDVLSSEGGVTGDDFGDSIDGLLANTGAAVGIAVFEGTEITPENRPIDAVFYNKPEGGFPFDEGVNSFLVPDKSDLYSAIDEDGNNQLYLGEGTNTFIVDEDIIQDKSIWLKMGGVFSENNTISPRTNPTTIQLGFDSDISEIESGSGVTEFRK